MIPTAKTSVRSGPGSDDVDRDALPVCLWHENPYRLVSLYDVLKFRAEDFCRASSLLGQISMDIKGGRMPLAESWGLIASEIGLLERLCNDLGLHATLAQIERVRHTISKGGQVHLANLGRDLLEIQIRMGDELKARTLLAVDVDKAQYLRDNQFSDSTREMFGDAEFDMDEAAKCFALERPTACVFHLMRIAEYGLQEVGRLVGLKDDRPNWEPILTKIDSEIKKPHKERQFKGDTDLLANISAQMHAVKRAWRNRAMHVDRKHTMEEAREIFEATRGLMRYLAENLSKPEQGGMLTAIRGKLGL